MADRPYNAVFTPEVVQIRRTVHNRLYLYARGVINNRNRTIRRTVTAFGAAFTRVRPGIRVGVPVKLTGFYKRVDNGPDLEGGEFFSATGIVQIYDAKTAPANHSDPLRTVAPHTRKGHWRRQRHGPGRSLVKMVFIEDVEVNRYRRAA